MMRMVWGSSIVSLAVVWAAFAGGAPATHETLVKDMLKAVDAITGELAKIVDEPSALAARPKLKQAAQTLLEVRKKSDDAKQPSKEEKDRLSKQYKEKFDTALKNLRDQTVRVKSIPGGEEALKEIAVLNNKKKSKQ